MAVEVATLNSSIRCRSVNTTLLLRCFWIKNCLTSFQKTFVAQHLRNRWEIVSISLWQKQHSSDCLRLIFFKKSLGAILRRKNVKWKVFNLVDAVQLKAIVCTSLTYTQSHTPPVVQGGGGDGTPARSFWCIAVFRNDFTLSRKPLIFLTRLSIFYGCWHCWRPVTSPTMVAISNFTKN